jgi:fatty-acyl-CoA synthase
MFNRADAQEILMWQKWYYNAEKYPDKDAIIHWVAEEEPFRWTFSSLISSAQKHSFLLKEYGIKQGDVCALIIRHNPNIYPLYMAVSKLGAIPAILAYPNPRLHPDKFRQGIEGMSQRSGLDWILTEKELDPVIKPLAERKGSTIKGIYFPLTWNINSLENNNFTRFNTPHQNIKSTDPFLLQHSSGTTGLQKPVLLSHQAVLKHVQNYAEAIQLAEKDKIVSWLPLYHDMGLIAAFHLPLAFGITSIQIDPFEWVIIPSLLLEAITKEKATVTWLPNFSYSMMADKIQDDELKEINLESMRLFINCSEPVRDISHKKFYNKFKKYGIRESSLSTCYAMAETTYAVTQSKPGFVPTHISVDRQSMSKGKIKIIDNYESARVCVSSGQTIKGCEIKIVDDERREIAADSIGEIAIKSVSMFDGYRNYPEKTAEVLKDGWYYTGDYGFKYQDEYYIIGRKKDIIIVAGNNIYPEDIEDVVSKVNDIIPGRVVAFGEEDTEIGSEQVSVIGETNISDEDLQKKLKTDIVKAGMEIDVTIKNIYLVPPRWLIKSSAGKPSRKANRQRILDKDEIKWR